MAPMGKAFVGLLLSLGGMNSADPRPANPVQQFLYSVAKILNDAFDPAPAPTPGTPTVSTSDPNTGVISRFLGFPTGD
jgi:hypothetical protein